MTNGCPGEGGEPGCTRPYRFLQPDSEPVRDYPWLPDADDMDHIATEMALGDVLDPEGRH